MGEIDLWWFFGTDHTVINFLCRPNEMDSSAYTSRKQYSLVTTHQTSSRNLYLRELQATYTKVFQLWKKPRKSVNSVVLTSRDPQLSNCFHRRWRCSQVWDLGAWFAFRACVSRLMQFGRCIPRSVFLWSECLLRWLSWWATWDHLFQPTQQR